jgi:anti-sigma B factor antagonist
MTTLQAMSSGRDPGDDAPLRRELRPSGPVRLTLSESTYGEATVLGVRGEFDLLTAPRVAAQLEEVVRGRSGDVIVDLRETVFIDSAAVQILLNTQRRLAQRSRKLAVVAGSGPVRGVLELSRVEGTLGLVASLEETGLGDG